MGASSMKVKRSLLFVSIASAATQRLRLLRAYRTARGQFSQNTTAQLVQSEDLNSAD